MGKFNNYIEAAINERMEGGAPVPTTSSNVLSKGAGMSGTVAETYELELVDKNIVGKVNGKDIGTLSIADFTKQFPEIAKAVLEVLKRDGAARYAPDKMPPADFVSNPQTGGKIKATPDI